MKMQLFSLNVLSKLNLMIEMACKTKTFQRTTKGIKKKRSSMLTMKISSLL